VQPLSAKFNRFYTTLTRQSIRPYSTSPIGLDEAKKTLEVAINSYEPSDESSRKDFQQVANGVFRGSAD